MGVFKKEEKFSISEVIKGLQHAADSTRDTTIHNHIALFDRFFDVEESGTLKAKMVQIAIDSEHDMFVPLISLIPPNALYLDRMNVKLSVSARGATSTEVVQSLEVESTSRTHFDIALSPKNTSGKELIDIELTFKSSEMPEAMMKVMDQYVNQIIPIPSGSDNSNKNLVKSVKT